MSKARELADLGDVVTVDTSGNVGIGTVAPEALLHVEDSGAASDDFTAMISAFRPNLVFEDTSAATINDWEIFVDTGDMAFLYGDATTGTKLVNEAMRIDDSGNLLVGGTVAFGADTITLGTGGFAGIRNTSGSCLELRRDTTDGDIQVFQKDGSDVGVIGTKSTDLYIGRAESGLLFDVTGADGIRPFNTTAQGESDGNLDLGSSSARFKDLYLSGGAYLGGTGAANYLDDYEEGTWSPVFSDASTAGNPAVANGGKRGFYTKIGNTVHVYCIGSNLVTTGMTGTNDLYIQGLPFTPTSFSSPNQSFVGTARLSDVAFTGYVVSQVTDATTYLRLNEITSSAAIDSIIVSQLTSAAADVILSMTYTTSS